MIYIIRLNRVEHPPLQIFLSGSTTKSKISVTGQLALFRLPLKRGKKLPPNYTATTVHQPCRSVDGRSVFWTFCVRTERWMKITQD